MTAVSSPGPALPRLVPPQSTWWKWLMRAASLGLFVLVAVKAAHTNPAELRKALPDSLWFWPTLLALYFTLPTADWLIFRRLWRLPLAGLPVLLAKRIGNELLLMYSGEAYFYLWARRRTGLTAAPFAAIRDVNLLSALAGNALTLLLVLVLAPYFTHLNLAQFRNAMIGSAVAVTAAPLLLTLLSRRLFVLSRREIAWVAGVHVARLMVNVLLLTQLWRLSAPEATPMLWFVLATVRLFIGRLPLPINAELVFATVASVLAGDGTQIAATVSLTSMALLLLHLPVAAGLACWSFFAREREPSLAVERCGSREGR